MLGNEALLVDRLCIYNKEHEKIADLNAKAVVDYVKLHGNLDYSHVFDEANYIERDIKVMKSLLADPKNGLGWQGERMVLESKGVDDLEKDSKHIALQKAKDFIFLPSEEVVKKYPDLERVYEMLTLLEKSNAGAANRDVSQNIVSATQMAELVALIANVWIAKIFTLLVTRKRRFNSRVVNVPNHNAKRIIVSATKGD